MMPNHFTLRQTDALSRARRGTLQTPHGKIETPIFMPVGTQATVKGLLPRDVAGLGAQIILGNTYHLNLRPGAELVAQMGGLHRFMGWDGPILTDSGGFQVFSLSALRKITDAGIRFRSHLDGQEVFLDPARVMEIQRLLGSDIAMVLDECPPGDAGRDVAEQAVERSLRWERQCAEIAHASGILERGQMVFGIVQGSLHEGLGEAMAAELQTIGFSGYALGGLSVGEPEPEMLEAAQRVVPCLPDARPRYVMGVGTPPQLLELVARGVDMFDCVMPSREGRHGIAFTPEGRLNLKNERFKTDPTPLGGARPEAHPAAHFSRSYLRHLLQAKELLGSVALTLHNLWFYLDLMAQARAHIEAGDFVAWKDAWIARYRAGSEGA